MRLDSSEPEEIKLNMTAMIDIVFQLLIFFIMTFKVTVMEGDFNIKMPLATVSDPTKIDVFPTLVSVRLIAGDDGGINSIICDNDLPLDTNQMFNELTNYIEARIAADGDAENAEETEVEFDIDYRLRYSFTIKAIESVSGRVEPDGTIRKLVSKIKFKDNKQQ